MTSPEVVRQVVLCDRQDSSGHFYEEAVLYSDGAVTVTGDDSGSSVETFFGPGLGDYEWTYDVPTERVADLVAALGGSPGDDVLTLIAEHYQRAGGVALGQLLQAEPVRASFNSYNS